MGEVQSRTGGLELADDGPLAGLFRDEYDDLVRLAFLMLSDAADAEEVVQDAFVALARRWNDVLRPGAYLRTSVVNGCRSRLRRRQTARRHEPRPADPVELGASELSDALEVLSDRQRAAVVLTYYSGMASTEVAEVLGCPTGTVKSLLHRGLKTLRSVIT